MTGRRYRAKRAALWVEADDLSHLDRAVFEGIKRPIWTTRTAPIGMNAERQIATTIAEARRPADASAVAALLREYGDYAAALGYDLAFQGFAAELAGLPGSYARPHGLLLIARSGAEAAGCAGYRPLAAGICEMKRLYVRPGFRGQGVGALLCRELIREARACGYRAMRLDTGAAMHSARRLYVALGFAAIPSYYETPYETLCFELLLVMPRR